MSSFAEAWPVSAEPQPPSARGAFLSVRFALFAGVSAACCGFSAAGMLRGAAVLPLALAAVAVAMWHGAYDHVQAKQILERPLGRRWMVWFLAGYAALAAVTLVGWLLFPLASLALFLLYSAWHFGTEPEERTPPFRVALPALALGAAPIVAACRWHGALVAPIFAAMLGRRAPSAGALTQALSVACWPVLGLALLGIAAGLLGRSTRERGELAAVLGLQAALFFWCDPLVAFAVYFCCWHTPEHLLATSMGEPGGLSGNLNRNLRAGFLPWVLSLAFLGAALFYGRHSAAAYQAQLFIVLSALTVPHMALNELRRALVCHPTFVLSRKKGAAA